MRRRSLLAALGPFAFAALGLACAPAREPQPESRPLLQPETIADRPGTASGWRGNEARALELPDNLDLSRKKRSESGDYLVSIRPARSPLSLNRIHNWWIRVADAEGDAADGLTLRFSGGMPAHGHGFPTSPRVTRGIGNGTYLVEGVKFNMSGWWEFVVEFEGADGAVADRVRFQLAIEE